MAVGAWIPIVVFWGAAITIAYSYLGYPALLLVWARLSARETQRRNIEPMVSVLVVAQDEQTCIAQRIVNLLALDYPAARLQIVVASDGSSDATAELARAHGEQRVQVFEFANRRGKAAVLNETIPWLKGEIVLLADARQQFAPDAVRALVACFAEPEVGVVSGELLLQSPPGGSEVGEGVGQYWRYEKMIRACESRIDSTVGATGAIYAFRRAAFRAIPPDTILDDVLIPMQIARAGYRVLFEPAARAFDRVAATAAQEQARKVRTIGGNFQLFSRHRWLLHPRRNRLWLQTISHKGLRLIGPLLLASLAVSNLFLLEQLFYGGTLLLQAGFYAAGAAGWRLRSSPRRHRLLAVVYTFCLLNWAAVIGFKRFFADDLSATWRRRPI